ncbi:hypothetical protein HOLleu_07258 [Holothuria leucospilota]|uniref:Uncharacterized protein n=1 Tax=Holothuria leucospilota TaxID=206669 RepID=A0A9Q1CHB2_HOLLE|nr:hypothetical protein HOLleu_07258 [Holothuria leucospilota]
MEHYEKLFLVCFYSFLEVVQSVKREEDTSRGRQRQRDSIPWWALVVIVIVAMFIPYILKLILKHCLVEKNEHGMGVSQVTSSPIDHTSNQLNISETTPPPTYAEVIAEKRKTFLPLYPPPPTYNDAIVMISSVIQIRQGDGQEES